MKQLTLALLLAGCNHDKEAVDSGAAACDTGVQVTWANWGQGFFRSYCTSCHSSTTEDRWGAPEGIDFDTKEDVAQWSSAVENAVLVEESMPVGGGVYEEDLVLLARFLDCGL